MEKTKIITLRVPTEVKENLEVVALEEGVTLNKLCSDILTTEPEENIEITEQFEEPKNLLQQESDQVKQTSGVRNAHIILGSLFIAGLYGVHELLKPQ